MGLMDKLKSKLHMGEAAVDRAGDMIDKKTDNKYKDQVDKAQDAAKDAMGIDRQKKTEE
ncbi:antitoxin [Streptomyces sp. O3]